MGDKSECQFDLAKEYLSAWSLGAESINGARLALSKAECIAVAALAILGG